MCIVIFWIKKFKQVWRTTEFRHAKLSVCQLCDSKDDDARWLSLAKPSFEAAFSSRHKCFSISPKHRRDFSFAIVHYHLLYQKNSTYKTSFRKTADCRHARLCVCQLCDSKDDDARWLSLAKPSLEAAFSSRHKCFTSRNTNIQFCW